MRLQEERKIKTVFNWVMIFVATWWGFAFLDISLGNMVTSFPNFITFFIQNFFPPNFRQLNVYLNIVFDTLLFAILGTYLSAILALPLGILMSEAITPLPLVRGVIRLLVSFLRNVPVLVWVSILVFVFGIGNLVGLVALTLVTLGFLARSYAESLDDIANHKLEALRSTGATPFQLFVHGLVPEFIPAWLNWTLFAFELNIRASAILGMVGAGGLGLFIQTSLQLRQFPQTSALVIVLVVMVLATEAIMNVIRSHLN